jgi:MerR family transcriptional regulator/heat shock protein HspR
MLSELKVSRHEPLITIGLAAERLGVSPMTLRMYEQRGLLLPHRRPSGRRYYSIHDLEIVLCIREMINGEGLNLEGIRRMMSLIPCWKMKPCTPAERKECVAYTDSIAPCWSLPETVCRRNGEDCRKCRVYRELPDCRGLKKMVNK